MGGAPKTVVIAEDETLIRMLAADRFTEAGYEVIKAEHAADALIALRRGGVHLLFTDIHMPGEMNGLDLARAVRRQWPHVHIIVTSGAEPAEWPEGGLFFRKPYQLDRVLAEAANLGGG